VARSWCRSTSELVRDAPVELADLGEHRLKDLGQPERIFQVVHPELERDFPQLRSLDAYPSNLPLQVTSFVGRDDDLARILKAVGEASLVTLVGTGGVGKTRLAMQAAAEVVSRFADGAWFCELASADDAESMAQIVASTLGCVQRPGMSMAASVVEYVKVRELLLVLDNCEQLLDEAGELAEAIVRSCPRVTVLATSREAFGVPGEHVLRVRSLAAPDPSATGADLLESAAVRLFADRAADAGAVTTWNDAQWAAVGEICRRVDGIPLAIELAAARVVSMGPTDIAAHLDERFRLLTGKRRGRVERHQTLRTAVDWSYQLLEPDDRTVFDRLGVFAGSFDAAAAGAVVGDEELDEWQVVDAIASLVAKSMLVTETGPDDTTRYAMLETLRQFARERLEEAGDGDQWRRQQSEHYARFAETAEPGFCGPDELVWVTRLNAEFDNIRTAVGWGLDRDDPADRELAVRTVAALAGGGTHRNMSALTGLASQAVSAAEQCRPELRTAVLAAAAHDGWVHGRVEQARALAEGALRDGVIATAPEPFWPHVQLGVIEAGSGEIGRALDFLNEGRAMFAMADNAYGEAWLLSTLSSFESMAGQVPQARADAERSLELARRVQNPSLLGNAFSAMAWAFQQDDPPAALAAAEQGIALRHKGLAANTVHAGMLALAGGLRARLGDPSGALDALHESVIVCRDLGARPSLAATLDWSHGVLVRVGRLEPAATIVGALTSGALADVGNFPLVANARIRTLERARATLGDDATDTLVANGAAMTYDDTIEYALHHLEPT
jgi:predicted ATPase